MALAEALLSTTATAGVFLAVGIVVVGAFLLALRRGRPR